MNVAKLVTLGSGIKIICDTEGLITFEDVMLLISKSLGDKNEIENITYEQWEKLIKEPYDIHEIKNLFDLTDLEYVYIFGAVWDEESETYMEDLLKRITTVVNSGVPLDNWFLSSHNRESETKEDEGEKFLRWSDTETIGELKGDPDKDAIHQVLLEEEYEENGTGKPAREVH